MRCDSPRSPVRRTATEPEPQLPPHDEAAERAVLGGLILDPGTLPNVRAKLQADDFYDLRTRAAWLAILGLAAKGKPIDATTVGAVLRDGGDRQGIQTASELLDAATGAAGSIAFHAGRVLDCSSRRRIVQAAGELKDAALDPNASIETTLRTAADALGWLTPRTAIRAEPIGSIVRPEHNDPDELIRHRFLCRGGGMLLAAPTGVGKSVAVVQLAMSWTLGKPCLGLEPARPMRCLYVQAENDEGDLAEIRDGIATGLAFSAKERARAFEGLVFSTVDDLCGREFIDRALVPLVEAHKPDLLFVDPLLAYLGGDVSKQEIVSPWLRNGLNPLLHRAKCGLVLVHHVNKPASGESKSEWKAGDFAYIGSGSADLANWARAVVAFRSLGDHEVFELRLGKRGRRVGWLNPDGTPCYAKRIAHGKDGGIYWREADAEEGPAPIGRRTRATAEQLVELLDGAELSTTAWRTLANDELGVAKTTFFNLRAEAEQRKLILRSKVSEKWLRAS